MDRRLTAIATLACGFLPALAFAQPVASDVSYCRALSEQYVRYIGHDETYSRRSIVSHGRLDAQVAVAQCRQGRTAEAIPVLEKVLRDNKFTLPVRG